MCVGGGGRELTEAVNFIFYFFRRLALDSGEKKRGQKLKTNL